MGKVFAITNQKGGVGKTTTTVNLGACLAAMGKKVLLIDIDPQGNATSGLGIIKNDVQGEMYNVLIKDAPIEEVILPTSRENLFIAPSTLDLSGAELELAQLMARESRLKKALEKVREEYDYILIDCPPALNLFTINAFTACDGLLIPVQTEYYALEGLSQLMKTLEMVRKHSNSKLKIDGVLLTMFDRRTNLGSEVYDRVRTMFNERVYTAFIRRNVALASAPSHGLPIIDFAPESTGAEDYTALAKEVIARG